MSTDDEKLIPPPADLQLWLQSRVARLVERKPPEVPVDEDFHALGLDSVGYLNLAIAIEEEWGIPITAKEIFLHSTAEKLAALLVEEGPEMRGRAQRLPKGAADCTTVSEGGDLAPLFWLNGYEFLELSGPHIPADRPVYYLHHQGSDGKSARFRTMEAMADYYLETILHVEPEGPYCLGGFSIGGPLAYEIACRLVALGKEVEILMLLSPAGEPRRLREFFLSSERRRSSGMGTLKRMLYMGRKHYGLYSRRLYNKVRRLRGRAQCYAYFWTGRPLPSRLIWTHMQPIYARARKHYTVSGYPGDTILVHESTIPVEEWCEGVEGACRVLGPVPIKHLELLSEEYAHLWLEEFLAPLAGADSRPPQSGVDEDGVSAVGAESEPLSGALGAG